MPFLFSVLIRSTSFYQHNGHDNQILAISVAYFFLLNEQQLLGTLREVIISTVVEHTSSNPEVVVLSPARLFFFYFNFNSKLVPPNGCLGKLNMYSKGTSKIQLILKRLILLPPNFSPSNQQPGHFSSKKLRTGLFPGMKSVKNIFG